MPHPQASPNKVSVFIHSTADEWHEDNEGASQEIATEFFNSIGPCGRKSGELDREVMFGLELVKQTEIPGWLFLLRLFLEHSFLNRYIDVMARPREFDPDKALDGAIKMFSEHGYEGASARMLGEAMGIGLQSIYAAFGDKWQLYCTAVHRYGMGECAAHLDALRSGAKAIDGIAAMLRRVVNTAGQPCLGVGSTYEFGNSKPEITAINGGLERSLRDMITGRVREGQRQGSVSMDIEPEEAANYLICCIAGIRVAGRGGTDKGVLDALVETALRSLR